MAYIPPDMYGIVVDNSRGLQELQSKLETLAQAALQNQTLSFSTIMKLFMTASLAEKQRFVEKDEAQILQRQQRQQQAALQQQENAVAAQMQDKQAEREFKDTLNQRDNETKVMVAEINSQAEMAILQLKNKMTELDKLDEDKDGIVPEYSQEAKDRLMQDMLKFNKQLELNRDKFEFEKKKTQEELEIKRMKAKTVGSSR